MSEQDECHQNTFLETEQPKHLKRIILDDKFEKYDLAFKFGDRFQAVNFRIHSPKDIVISQLRLLADNIEKDELIS